MATIQETCSCGAVFWLSTTLHSQAESAAAAFREDHQHVTPTLELPTYQPFEAYVEVTGDNTTMEYRRDTP